MFLPVICADILQVTHVGGKNKISSHIHVKAIKYKLNDFIELHCPCIFGIVSLTECTQTQMC